MIAALQNFKPIPLDMDDLVIGLADEELAPGQAEDPGRKKISAKDAFYMSVNQLGRVDLAYMEETSGLTPLQLDRELRGKLYWEDPDTGDLLTRQQMGRGNIRKKLADLKARFGENGRFHENIDLLTELLPARPDMDEIDFSPAASWIPHYYLKIFIRDLLNMVTEPQIEFDQLHRKCSIRGGLILDDFNNTSRYGTPRISGVKIFEHTINGTEIEVRDPVDKPEYSSAGKSQAVSGTKTVYVLNEGETLLAREKQKDQIKAFREWVAAHPKIQERLYEVYCDTYGYAICRYDGSHQDLPDLNPEVKLQEHQKGPVERIKASGQNVLLAGDVGEGKTFEYTAGVHELLRIGAVKKALITVPGQVLSESLSVWHLMYPEEEVLAVTPETFRPAVRKETLRKICKAETRIVFMAHSTFDMLTMSRDYYLSRKLKEIHQAGAALKAARLPSTAGRMKSALARLQKEYKKLLETLKETETACFESLGFDCLVVDEAHNYRYITLPYRLGGVSGCARKGSKKSDELMEKAHFIEKKGGRVIFATATPITNSLADLYVMMKYLQPEEMEMLRISGFAEWVNTFCDQNTNFEVDMMIDGRFKTRFSQFHNLPELMALFSNVCEFSRGDIKDMDLPDFGRRESVIVPRLQIQKEFFDEMRRRNEAIHLGEVSSKEDNGLKLTMEGRMCSTHPGLVMPEAQYMTLECKPMVCAGKVYDLYREYPGTTQLIFCDFGTPKDTFNIYDEMKFHLMRLGIPEREIAYIHEAATEARRDKLFKAFNDGEIRVLLGSTGKLGTGVNVQKRCIAVHHLDVCWKPSDIRQRRGRMLRQGNRNRRVYEFCYCTEKSFDAYLWQILENKQRFIDSFLDGTLSIHHRKERDVSDTVLTYSEIKALTIGNPLVKKRVETANLLERTNMARREKQKELDRFENLLLETPIELEKKRHLLTVLKKADAFYQKNKQTVPQEERETFGKELLLALSGNAGTSREQVFDWYQGFDVVLPDNMEAEHPYVLLRCPEGGTFRAGMKTDRPLGCCMRLDHVLEGLSSRAEQTETACRVLEDQMKQAREELDKGNIYESRIVQLQKELDALDEQITGNQ